MPKDAYYFPHDSNARNDEKILELRNAMGWEGYGLYWAIIEMLRDSPDHTLKKSLTVLQQSFSISQECANNFLNSCLEVGLLNEKDGRIFSESLLSRMIRVDAIRQKRREAGALGGKVRGRNQANAKQTLPNAKQMLENVEASKGKESKENWKKKFNELFGRRDSTKWSDAEIRSFNKLELKEEEFELVKLHQTHSEYRRRKLLTLLNNYADSIDSGRSLLNENPHLVNPRAEKGISDRWGEAYDLVRKEYDGKLPQAKRWEDVPDAVRSDVKSKIKELNGLSK